MKEEFNENGEKIEFIDKTKLEDENKKIENENFKENNFLNEKNKNIELIDLNNKEEITTNEIKKEIEKKIEKENIIDNQVEEKLENNSEENKGKMIDIIKENSEIKVESNNNPNYVEMNTNNEKDDKDIKEIDNKNNNLEEQKKTDIEQIQNEIKKSQNDEKEEKEEEEKIITKEKIKDNLIEEVNQNNIQENSDKKNEEIKFFKEMINSNLEILDFTDIKANFEKNIKELNKKFEKNKIITDVTDVYQIKIDIGNPLEQNNEDNKGSNCKSEKLIENISKEESEVNKENIQNNGQQENIKIDSNKKNNDSNELKKITNNIIDNQLIVKLDEIINNDIKKEENNNQNLDKELEYEKIIDKIEISEEKTFIDNKLNIKDNHNDVKNNINVVEIGKLKENKNEIKNQNEVGNDNNIKSLNKKINENENISKNNEDKKISDNKILSKKDSKTKPFNKKTNNVKFGKQAEIANKNIFPRISNKRKLIHKSEKKFFKKKDNRVSPFENKHFKYRKQSDKNIIKNNNNLRKEKLSPFTNRRNQMSQLEKKSKNICKTIETKEKLTDKKINKKIENKEKLLKLKKNLRLYYDLASVFKPYNTQNSFKNIIEKTIPKKSKLEKKSFCNKSKIISIDKMKNANRIINRKKKIDKILNYSKFNKTQDLIKSHKNIIKSYSDNSYYERFSGEINKKNNSKNLNLNTKDTNINNKFIKSKDSLSSWESDLGDVGEIIEDEGESEIGNELNELNENNFINNPKSIITYSSLAFMDENKNKKERLAISFNKREKNSKFIGAFSSLLQDNSLKKNNDKIIITDLKEVSDKIRKKQNEIEKFKKQIEIYKRYIKEYDKINLEVENRIKIEEELRNEYQMMINYLNKK